MSIVQRREGEHPASLAARKRDVRDVWKAYSGNTKR